MNNTKVDFKNVLAGIGIGVVVLFLVFLAADRNGSITASLLTVETSELVNNDIVVADSTVWSTISVIKEEVPAVNSKNVFSFQYDILSEHTKPKPLPFNLIDNEFKNDFFLDKAFSEKRVYSIPLSSGVTDKYTYIIEEVEKAPPYLKNYNTTYSCFVYNTTSNSKRDISLSKPTKGLKITITPEMIKSFKLEENDRVICIFTNTKKGYIPPVEKYPDNIQ